MLNEVARCINVLGEFCGRRDVPELTQTQLQAKYGFSQADVMVLFGGSILCGGDVLAQAMRDGVAKRYVIVGGEGHTTETLRQLVHARYPQIDTAGLPEAQVFAAYLRQVHGLQPDLLECESTNCGNNITYLLRLLAENGVPHRSIILTQDATMQLRMDAGLRRHAPDVCCINYAAYAAAVTVREGSLAYERSIPGMWDVERYISLLLGEIPRLSDDADGYGPQGKGFIAHVDVPPQVRQAFDALKGEFPQLVRAANPLYASRNR